MTQLLKRVLILDTVAVPLMLLYWWLMGSHTVVRLKQLPRHWWGDSSHHWLSLLWRKPGCAG